MKRFLLIVLGFSLSVLVILLFILSQADGHTDPYYVRFTTKKQKSLILGTSRAAHGLQPKIINEILDRNDVFNYAFTNINSPYGSTYFKNVKKKLDKADRNGIFILTVDPYSISSSCENPNDTLNFREVNLTLAQTRFVNLKPNFLYLLKSYDKPFINLIIKNEKMFLHDDGWLEIRVKMDSVSIKNRTSSGLKDIKTNIIPFYKFSVTRLSYFIKTIEYLKKHGEVYIVRLPTGSEFMKYDNILSPNFDSIISDVSLKTKTPYLNMTINNNKYLYDDGAHLSKESGFEVSREIATWILSNR